MLFLKVVVVLKFFLSLMLVVLIGKITTFQQGTRLRFIC